MSAAATIAPPWERIPATAHALSAFRELPDGRGRAYTMAWFPRDPNGGIRHFVRMLAKTGMLAPADAEGWYAVLDVCDADGDFVAEYGIPDARSFQWIKRKLKLAVASTDGDELPAPVETREDS